MLWELKRWKRANFCNLENQIAEMEQKLKDLYFLGGGEGGGWDGQVYDGAPEILGSFA